MFFVVALVESSICWIYIILILVGGLIWQNRGRSLGGRGEYCKLV
jgi:hypothetical protein